MEKLTASHATRGFTLPVILIISVGLMIVGLSLVQSTSSVRDSLEYQYQQRLDSTAAEAGTVYANYCLSTSDFNQTWGPATSKPNLTQKTDCAGTTLASAPAYLMDNGTRRSGFSIGDLTVRSDGAIIYPAIGTYQQTRGGTSQLANTSSSTRKQVVEWKTYIPSVSASGTGKTCAIVTHELYCWGKNSVSGSDDHTGQLGNGTSDDSLIPAKVRANPGDVLYGKVINDVTSAQYHSCALAGGKVYCWGQNDYGQLGDGTINDSNVPVAVRANVGDELYGKTVTAISTSGNASCAIANAKIYCWGWNATGQTGNNTTTAYFSTPTAVATLGGATGLASTYSATMLSSSGSRSPNMCAVADAKAYCWGMNQAGQIGNGVTGGTYRSPTKVTDTGVLAGKTITAITQDGFISASGYPHVCVVASGAVYCWGENISGQLGRAASNTTDSNVPVAVLASGVLSGKTVQDVVAGLLHTCVLANSKVYCWGANGAGQLGDNSTSTRYVPVAVHEGSPGLSGKTVNAIGGGANRGCAIAGFETFCWGLNDLGQLGDNTQTNRIVPTESVFLRPKAPAYIF